MNNQEQKNVMGRDRTLQRWNRREARAGRLQRFARYEIPQADWRAPQQVQFRRLSPSNQCSNQECPNQCRKPSFGQVQPTLAYVQPFYGQAHRFWGMRRHHAGKLMIMRRQHSNGCHHLWVLEKPRRLWSLHHPRPSLLWRLQRFLLHLFLRW